MSNETETVTNEEEVQTANLAIDDVMAMHQVVDVCVKRGAIHAGEMEYVGKLFNRVGEFLNKVNPQPTEELEGEAGNAHAEGE